MDTLGNKIRKLREARNMTQTELSQILGMKTYTTVSKWESNDNFPKGKDLKKLAEFFNVTSDYLLGLDSIKPNRQTSTTLTQIADTSAKLKKDRQKKVLNFAKKLEQKQNFERQNIDDNNVLSEFEQYRESKIVNGRSSAAGAPLNGDIQDGEASVMVVDQREIPSNADEIITIAGDSMEPLILNGEQVFIHWTPVVEQGEIALVSIVDEGVTCKKVYWDDKEFTLRSINEKYDDMVYPLSDVRIIGKVL